jgi:acetyl esterase/lipase
MAPEVDDEFCTDFSNEYKFCVVSINYRKAPAHPFPTALQDVTAIAKTVIEDETLPIDKSKIAIGGFSAGANLAFAVSQMEDMKGLIGGVVGYYPPVDFTRTVEEQLATRPENAGPDPLEHKKSLFDWAYMNPGLNKADPLMSVGFAPRDKLPEKLCLVGVEFDLLCRDAEVMAEKLAEVGSGERNGTDVAWEKNGVKWEKILGENHGMDDSGALLDSANW